MENRCSLHSNSKCAIVISINVKIEECMEYVISRRSVSNVDSLDKGKLSRFGVKGVEFIYQTGPPHVAGLPRCWPP